jgi:hypothetical protein
MLLVLVGVAALAVVAVLVFGSPFGGDDPVTRTQIEQAVAKKPTGKVQVVLCNEEVIPSENPRPNPPHTWTCDTYLGPSRLHTQNGPSYQVLVSNDRDHIESIRRVPTH